MRDERYQADLEFIGPPVGAIVPMEIANFHPFAYGRFVNGTWYSEGFCRINGIGERFTP